MRRLTEIEIQAYEVTVVALRERIKFIANNLFRLVAERLRESNVAHSVFYESEKTRSVLGGRIVPTSIVIRKDYFEFYQDASHIYPTTIILPRKFLVLSDKEIVDIIVENVLYPHGCNICSAPVRDCNSEHALTYADTIKLPYGNDWVCNSCLNNCEAIDCKNKANKEEENL